MSHTSDIFSKLKKVQIDMLDQLQRAAQPDARHYEITNLQQLQVAFTWKTDNKVTYSGELTIYPKRIIEEQTMSYFMRAVASSMNMDLVKFHEDKNAATGSIHAPDYREVYSFQLKGKFTPNELPAAEDQLVLSYEEIEDLTSFAVHESADLPEQILYEMLPYHMLEFDSEQQTATYKKGSKIYE